MDTEQIQKTSFWKNKKFWYGVLVLFFVGTVIDVLDDNDSQTNINTQTEVAPIEVVAKEDVESEAPSEAVANQTKENAQKELDEVMKLAQTSGLVTSYEFSEKANVVYVGKIWYTQTVAFKKDFMGKVAGLKKTITGYHRFEILDTYSNEKVAEVTAFSGSLEVYK